MGRSCYDVSMEKLETHSKVEKVHQDLKKREWGRDNFVYLSRTEFGLSDRKTFKRSLETKLGLVCHLSPFSPPQKIFPKKQRNKCRNSISQFLLSSLF